MTSQWRAVVGALLATAVTASFAACGSSSDEPPSTQAGTTGDVAASSNDLGNVEAARAAIARAIEGPVYSDKPELEVTPEDLQPVTEWTGPEEAPKPEPGKNLRIIVCLVGTSCGTMGDAAAEAAKALGWSAKVIDGKGTPQGANDAMNTALSESPDAIITVAVPESQIADKVARAKQRKIPIVGISAVPENVPQPYDAYVSLKETVTAKLQAWWAIADSDGKAQSIFVWDRGYPHLNEALTGAEQVFAACEGCDVLQTYKRALATAADPVAMGQLANSIAQRYGDRVGYILTPYGFGVAPVAQAIKARGLDTKVLSKNADAQNLGMVAEGIQAADFGSSLEWAGYAGVDQTNRLLAGQETIPDAEQGLPVRAYDQSNAPVDGKVDWTTPVDFKKEYLRVWGVS